MKNLLLAVCGAFLLAVVSPVQAQVTALAGGKGAEHAEAEHKRAEAQSFAQYQAVADALQPYIAAAKTGDGKTLRTAFYDHAHIVGSYDGAFVNKDADTFASSISKGGPSPKVQHHIAWIDISGPAAAAKVEFINWRGNRFTDFFVLYKSEGEWKISGKVYNSHSNN